jgi:hypothetical protein
MGREAISLCLLMLLSSALPSSGQLVINEIELSPPSAATMWVELFNRGSETADLTGWAVEMVDGAWAGRMPLSGPIEPKGYRVAEGDARWISRGNGTAVLIDASGRVIDSTPLLSDHEQDEFTHARMPNGRDTDSRADFAFVRGSRGRSN